MDAPPWNVHVRFMPFDLLIEHGHQPRDVLRLEAPEYLLDHGQRARVRAHVCPPDESRQDEATMRRRAPQQAARYPTREMTTSSSIHKTNADAEATVHRRMPPPMRRRRFDIGSVLTVND